MQISEINMNYLEITYFYIGFLLGKNYIYTFKCDFLSYAICIYFYFLN